MRRSIRGWALPITGLSLLAAAVPATTAQAAEQWTIAAEATHEWRSKWKFADATASGDAVWLAGSQNEAVDSWKPSIARWDGSQLVEIPPPPSGDASTIEGLSAPSSTNVWVTVDHDTWEPSKRIYHYDGSEWHSVTTTNSGPKIDQVSASASRAWTIANDHWVARYLDGKWTRMEVTTTGEVEAIDARARDDVWAVGNLIEGEGDEDEPPTSSPLATHWNGTKWTKTTVPAKDCELTDVTAVTSKDAWTVCVAHGDSDRSSVVLRWNGSAWKQVGDAIPVSTVTASFDGSAWASSGGRVWHYDGAAWTFSDVQDPSGANAEYDTSYVRDLAVPRATHDVVAAGYAEYAPEDPMGDPYPSIDLIWRNG